jgi:hypothetical protein
MHALASTKQFLTNINVVTTQHLHLCCYLDITVEQGDGSVTVGVGTRLAPTLVDEDNQQPPQKM